MERRPDFAVFSFPESSSALSSSFSKEDDGLDEVSVPDLALEPPSDFLSGVRVWVGRVKLRSWSPVTTLEGVPEDSCACT